MSVRPPEALADFENYEAFVEFAGTLFDLKASEFQGLYEVLLKLQAIGENPVETMIQWRRETCGGDCPDFIRFMINVDNMEIDQIRKPG